MAEQAWEDEDDDQSLEREWDARKHQFHVLGYRDGISAGKESSVQKGFNAGFQESVIAGIEFGVARGLTSAFAALSAPSKELLVEDENLRKKLQNLHVLVSSVSSQDAILSYMNSKQPHSSNLRNDSSAELHLQEDASVGLQTSTDIDCLVSRVKAEAANASIDFSTM